MPGTATTSATDGSQTPPATALPPPQPHSPLRVFICLMALSALVIGLAPAAAAYVTSWGSMLWFWIMQGPVVGTVPHRYTDTPPPSIPRTPPTRAVPIRLQLPCRHIIHCVALLLIIGGATDHGAHHPAKVDTAQTCNRTTRRRAALHRRHLRPLPWSMNRLPWQLRLLSLLLSHCRSCSQSSPHPISPSYCYPHSGEVTGTISSSHVMWDLARLLLLLSNDIHPLPGHGRLHTFKVLSLNMGGPHLSKKRWNQLLQETTVAQPTLIAYQEVRFKSGYNHMCQVARMAPQYQPMTHTANNPDVIFLVHRSIAQYTRLLQPAHPCGVAVEVSLPDRPTFSAANIHGPFDQRSRTSLDHWISQLPRLGLLMGDFNHGKESVWPRHRPLPWWHHKLLDGTLLDPASCTTTDMNSPLLTTRKGVRLDAVLVSDTIWHALTPTGCSTRTYPSAGDHKAVAAVFGSAIQDGSDHREYTGSVQHWHTGTFNTFQKHMTKWSRLTSLSGSP